jgi:hypothetical protein
MNFRKIKGAWGNAYYRVTLAYICIVITLIFGFQMYRYFVSAPSDEITCDKGVSAMTLIPVIGVMFDA